MDRAIRLSVPVYNLFNLNKELKLYVQAVQLKLFEASLVVEIVKLYPVLVS